MSYLALIAYLHQTGYVIWQYHEVFFRVSVIILMVLL